MAGFKLSNLLPDDNDLKVNTARTVYGGKITPEVNANYAQKLFATTSGSPNMPKPQSMFRVFFHINSLYDTWKQEKDSLISYTTKSEMVNNLNEETKSDFINFLGVEKKNTAAATTNKIKTWATGSNNINIADLDTIIDSVANKVLSYELSLLVKSYNIPSITMETTTMNEYNRRRNLYLTGTKYGDLTLTFFDVKENQAQQFFFNYLKMINNDFFMKGNKNWDRRESPNKWNAEDEKTKPNVKDSTVSYDYNPFGYTTDTNNQLITTIYICEYLCDKMVVYAIKNPKIKTIDFGSGSKDSMASKEIKVTFSVEGITNDMTDLAESLFNVDSSVFKKAAYYRSMVNSPINEGMAGFLNTRYLSNAKAIKGVYNSIFKAVLGQGKDVTMSSLTEQVKTTTRMMVKAESINSAEKFKATLRNETKKKSNGRWQQLYNVKDDPTSIIGSAFFNTSLVGLDVRRILKNL